jgi:hypothetical protein
VTDGKKQMKSGLYRQESGFSEIIDEGKYVMSMTKFITDVEKT